MPFHWVAQGRQKRENIWQRNKTKITCILSSFLKALVKPTALMEVQQAFHRKHGSATPHLHYWAAASVFNLSAWLQPIVSPAVDGMTSELPVTSYSEKAIPNSCFILFNCECFTPQPFPFINESTPIFIPSPFQQPCHFLMFPQHVPFPLHLILTPHISPLHFIVHWKTVFKSIYASQLPSKLATEWCRGSDSKQQAENLWGNL